MVGMKSRLKFWIYTVADSAICQSTGGNRFSRRRRFHPLVDPPSFFVPKRSNANKDEIDKGPDTEASQGQKHQDSGPCLSEVKPVGTETPKEKTEQRCCQTGFGRNSLSFHGSPLVSCKLHHVSFEKSAIRRKSFPMLSRRASRFPRISGSSTITMTPSKKSSIGRFI